MTTASELMYSDFISRTVSMVTDGGRSGDILVHVYNGIVPRRKNKIIRYQGKNMKQEISNDGQGFPIFMDGHCSLYMSENNNGDVCVSDLNADTVVVVDKTGRVQFRYDGKPARREKSFIPAGIVTNVLSQIIVADLKNNCLHILDQNGQFLKCVDDCGLRDPDGLSVDSEGRLWVGSYDSGEIKVIKYL